MEMISIFIVIFIIIIILIKIKQSEYDNDREWQHANWLSTDKKPELYKNGYVIYANGSRWYLQTFVDWKLYWIPITDGNDLDKLICDSMLEFQCTWLPHNKMLKIINRIINTHPNLETHGFWKIRKLFN